MEQQSKQISKSMMTLAVQRILFPSTTTYQMYQNSMHVLSTAMDGHNN